MFSTSPLALFDYFLGAPQTKQATRSTKVIGVTLTEALAKCSNSQSALQAGLKRGDVYVNQRGYYCFKREEDNHVRSLSDTTGAKSSVHQTPEQHDQLAEFLKDGEFGWASSLLQGTEVPEIPRPASPEVGNPKIDPHAHPPDCLESGLVSLAQ